MPTRERLAALGNARGAWLVRRFGDELRQARLAAGLSQASVAAAAGLSQQTISRFELGQPPHPDFVQAARVAIMVGLEVRFNCYPAPGQLRDAGHVGLIGRLLARVAPTARRQLESPVQPGDQRAWDVLVQIGTVRIGVIAETRIRDLQALLRRENRKQLDGRVDRLILLVADTKTNRASLDEAGAILATSFPLRTRAILAALGRGEAPSANGVVVL
jgi:transcriptional regulator with XRE-family HTH domain